MLEPLITSTTSEKVLIFLTARQEGYLERSPTSSASLRRPDAPAGETRRRWHHLQPPRRPAPDVLLQPLYPFLTELQALLAKVLTFYPEDLRGRLERQPAAAAKK